MTLNAPKKITLIISLVLAVLGVVGSLISIPIVSTIALWVIVAAYVLLALSTVLKGL